jgi:hypothetical protein
MKKINSLLWLPMALFFLLCTAHSLVSAATIDVMIVYDSTAKAWVDSNGGMNTFAADAIARMNQAAGNSNINLTFRLVYAAQVSYTYSGDLGTDLENLQAGAGNMAIVHQWRDTYGADLVVLLEDTGSAYGWVGVGYLLQTYSGDPDYAFTASAIRSVDISHTLTHEIGHNLGADHSKYQAQDPGPNTYLNTYSAGWYFTGTNGTPYHTIMAYNDQDGDGYADHSEAPLFSTPLLNYQGTVAGSATDGDNARTIRQTMDAVASYRAAIVDTTIFPESANFGPPGGVGNITVTTTWGHPWTATSLHSWITITSGASGTGSGSVGYSVALNATGLARTGNIRVAEKTFRVIQDGDSTITLSPTSANYDVPGGWGSIAVTAASSGFYWKATTSVSWISILTGNNGTGNGTITFNVLPNETCSNRGGVITVAGAAFIATQLGNSVNCWRRKADFGGASRGMAVGFSIGNKGYIGTGYGYGNGKDFWEYDPITDTWTQKADFVTTGLRYEAVGFSIGNKGYIGMGNDFSSNLLQKDFWEYDPALNTWTQKADFGGGVRYEAVGFSIGNKGYIGTGDDWNSFHADFWEYDPALNTWTQKADFGGTARHWAVGFSIGSMGYTGTGWDGSYRKDFWEYDPALNTWTQKADFAGAARYDAVGFSIGSKGYIGTGLGIGNTKDFWEYDPQLNNWTEKTALGGIEYYAVAFSIGSKGYIGTGAGGGSFLVDFWEYTPDIPSSSLYATFPGYGLYKYDGTSWSQINSVSPSSMVASGSILYANFAGYGLYKWENGAWTQLNSLVASNMVASGSTLYANFAGYGLYKYNGTSWSQLNSVIATDMVATSSALYANFAGYGLYKYNGTSWSQLNSVVATSMVASGSTLYANFAGYGLYKYNGTSWSQLNSVIATDMVATSSALCANFAGYGLYKYNGTSWSQLNSAVASSMVATDSALYANFAGYGLYQYNGTSWTQINSVLATDMVASGSALYVDFAGYGIYKYEAGIWTQLNPTVATSMVAGL